MSTSAIAASSWVQIVRDSGAFYMGRDWTYQGNWIIYNRFENINSIQSGNDVSAVYLDDFGSGFFIAHNVFRNVSRALLLGGGRDNYFYNNTITDCGAEDGSDAAAHVDNRGMGWASGSCTKGGILLQFLDRVPYNTSAAWAKYAHLAQILQDDPCRPKYNAIVANGYCNVQVCCEAKAQNVDVVFAVSDRRAISGWMSTMPRSPAGPQQPGTT
jgi:hypothetical protein